MNNPVNLEDPSGYLSWKSIGCIVAAVAVVAVIAVTAGVAAPIILGAVLGAASSAALSAVDQVNNGNGHVDEDKVVQAASFGAMSGALGGSAIGKIGQYVGNGVIGTVSTYVDNPKAKPKDYAISFGINAAAAGLSGAGAQSYENNYGFHIAKKVITNQYLSASAKSVANASIPPFVFSGSRTVTNSYKKWYDQQNQLSNEYMPR
jgi:hypothetical protein